MKLSERLEALLARLEETTDGEYLERLANGHAIALQCMEFLRDHGPALAALARRVEGAAVVEMPSRPGPALQGASLVIGAAAAERMGLAGQRVRIVPDNPTPQEVPDGGR